MLWWPRWRGGPARRLLTADFYSIFDALAISSVGGFVPSRFQYGWRHPPAKPELRSCRQEANWHKALARWEAEFGDGRVMATLVKESEPALERSRVTVTATLTHIPKIELG